MPDDDASIRADWEPVPPSVVPTLDTRGYQQEMLEESLRRNIVIALDTGAGKTYIAILRMKHETERESRKVGMCVVVYPAYL
jgi:endoribonuclease Dicer